ncbi:MAG: CPBP family intramembrane metalloprotease [Acidobacteria bacterium]|nr:CPBP family intramembrane metalloprotease [Acidobacteriota bacterium]
MSGFRQQPEREPEGDDFDIASEPADQMPKALVASGAKPAEQLPLWSPDMADPAQAQGAAEPTASNAGWKPAPEKDPPWSLEDLFIFIGFAFLSFLFASFVGVVLVSVLRQSFGVPMGEQALASTPWVVAMQSVWELLWLGFIYLTIRKKYHRDFWQALKWVWPRQPAATFLIAGVAVAFAAQAIMNLFPSQKHLPIEKLFSSVEAAYLLAFFGVFVAPFIEELVFRGFFYPVFERMWGLSVAVVLTALLFAGIHVPQLSGGWQEITSIFVVGAVFSYCRGKTGSLVPPFLMHFGYNASLFVSLYISTDGFHNLKG